MVLRDRLHLQRLLLRVMSRKNLVENHNRAVSVPRREYKTLPIRRPTPSIKSHFNSRLSGDEGLMHVPRHVREFIVVQLAEKADGTRLLRIVNRHGVHRDHGEQHAVRQRKD